MIFEHIHLIGPEYIHIPSKYYNFIKNRFKLEFQKCDADKIYNAHVLRNLFKGRTKNFIN